MHVLPALLPVPKGRPVPRGRGEGEGTWGQGCPWEPTSSGIGTTVSQAGPCWEMAPCRAGLAPSPGCQPPSCPQREQSLPWALPQTPSILGGLARGGHTRAGGFGGLPELQEGAGGADSPGIAMGGCCWAGTVLCPLLAQALPPTGAASPPQQGEGLGMRSGGLGAPVGTGSLPPTPLPPARLAHLPPSPLEHLSPGEFGSVSQICCLPASDPADYPSQFTHPSLPRLPIPAPA